MELPQHGLQRQRPGSVTFPAAEDHQFPGQLRGALGGQQDILGVRASRGVEAGGLADLFGVADDDAEHVVEVMRQAANQHYRPPLGLGLDAAGDVPGDAGCPDDRAIGR